VTTEVEGGSLLHEAQRFANELTHTVQSVISAPCDPFHAIAVKGTQELFSVRQQPSTGIALTVEGTPLLSLVVSYRCSRDTAGQYLAVESSEFKVYAGSRASGEPLFRYDYVHDTFPGVPCAHIQVHAHRDALAYVMTRAGERTIRGKRRARSLASGDEVPRMSELHLPVGGTRFRPCLEDVLEVLVQELGVDHRDDWVQVLGDGRERWRRTQLRTVVRDDPREAADMLRTLGFEVTWSRDEDLPAARADRLRQL